MTVPRAADTAKLIIGVFALPLFFAAGGALGLALLLGKIGRRGSGQ
jgi:hypothetical protein